MVSVVVAPIVTGAPSASDKTCCASSRRLAIFGEFPTICSETLLILKELLSISFRRCLIISTPDASFHSGLSIPKTDPTSPSAQADKTASQSACAAASPSEWPAKRLASGQVRPASAQLPSSANLCASTPTPTRKLMIATFDDSL